MAAEANVTHDRLLTFSRLYVACVCFYSLSVSLLIQGLHSSPSNSSTSLQAAQPSPVLLYLPGRSSSLTIAYKTAAARVTIKLIRLSTHNSPPLRAVRGYHRGSEISWPPYTLRGWPENFGPAGTRCTGVSSAVCLATLLPFPVRWFPVRLNV